MSRGKLELRPTELTGGKTEKTTKKREEQAFIAGRTGTLHHRLQLKGGRGEGSMVPSESAPGRAPLGLWVIWKGEGPLRSKAGPIV